MIASVLLDFSLLREARALCSAENVVVGIDKSSQDTGRRVSVTGSSIHDLVAKFKADLSGLHSESQLIPEEPLKSELFNAEQMEEHGRQIARTHQLRKRPMKDQLLGRLADNERVLHQVHDLLTQASTQSQTSTPAGEWLMDNFYLIEEQIRFTKKHFERVYSEHLIQLADGPAIGLPRVYDIAVEIISHSDGRIDIDTLNMFVKAYQRERVISIGELWALPIMLRLALIENLRRVCTHIATDRIYRNLADFWAKRMIAVADSDPKSLILVVADMARSNPPLEKSFVAELSRQLRGKGNTLAQALSWIEDRLVELGQSSTELVQSENQKLATHQVSVSNSIGSLRLVGGLDWRDFVESNSYVEQILRRDACYANMDFSTRDQYRHVVERIAKHSLVSEEEIAQIAIDLSTNCAASHRPEVRCAHVGYYLIDKGVTQTEQQAKMQVGMRQRLRHLFGRHALLSYSASILIVSVSLSLFLMYFFVDLRATSTLKAIIAVLLFFCTTQLAVTVVNFLSSLLVEPQLLPRLDYSLGIPEASRSLVVIPGMLGSEADIKSMAEALEVRFLANKDANLYFALLTDFPDSLNETDESDSAAVAVAVREIESLNRKYAEEFKSVFYLFHRPRRWNERDKLWMGYERKRGKLEELNGLLRSNSVGCFSTTVGDLSVLPSIVYVITLDVDTQLPRDTARKLIGSIAHPLNKAVYDPVQQRVVDGYGILQPRLSTTLPGSGTTLYARLNANDPGIDPYTRATSDTYQDLFAEGSFIGKGIYDVDIFEKALKHRFPTNTILSHDLLEGCYVRSALLSDVQLFEKYPERYLSDMQRRHRWIRGDWQIAAWCLPYVPDSARRWQRSSLSALSRWKILDNLRRSLVPLAFTMLLVASWLTMHSVVAWTLCLTGIFILPDAMNTLWFALRKPHELSLAHHINASLTMTWQTIVRVGFRMMCLPYEAALSVDAIVRTLWRVIVSRKNLLEWTASANVERSLNHSVWSYHRSMWIEIALGLASSLYIIASPIAALGAAGPILLSWMLCPLLSWWLSIRLPQRYESLSAQQTVFIRTNARRTWAYFEVFVRAEENWLPPDNFQESPQPVIAHRTSPTNMGLSLLANLAAHDFGYISTSIFIERCQASLGTMEKMERYQGHFYNWYDTLSLRVLWPRYVSTVDSGNLCGHLLTLRQGILELLNAPILSAATIEGILDTTRVLMQYGAKSDIAPMNALYQEFVALFQAAPRSAREYARCLSSMSVACEQVLPRLTPDPAGMVVRWTNTLRQSIHQAQHDLEELVPWMLRSQTEEDPYNGQTSPASDHDRVLPSLRDLAVLAQQQRERQASWTVELALNQVALSVDDADFQTLRTQEIAAAVVGVHRQILALENLAEQCADMAEVEYEFLYNTTKQLLTIGYNTDDHRCDNGFYDLLASEARLSTFVAIAQGKIPQAAWFALGRLLTNSGGSSILLSWGGSMFEYLMPFLVMPSFEATLLDQTRIASVERQIAYGKFRDVPWGISESGYNMIDSSMNYQYQAFGVPGLGIKRGLERDLVIAPYATALALMVAPDEACDNLERMSSSGFSGDYGFYEAIDYTASRLPRGQHEVIVQSYMSHHLSMSFLSMLFVVCNRPMQRRFEAEPQFQASLLLLQERIPKVTSIFAHTASNEQLELTTLEPEIRLITTPNTPIPEIQLLSNGRYHLMITNSGGGYSRWNDLAITRWREDSTTGSSGAFCYIRDLDNGEFWSTTYQPTLQKGSVFEAVFSQGRADFRIQHHYIDARTEIIVSPEDDIEVRRLHLSNRSSTFRHIDITSYAEVVLAPIASEEVHPVFSNLFVQTEILAERHAVLCTRRPRSDAELQPWMFFLMKVHDKSVGEVSYETDRMRFLGRGKTVANPDAMRSSANLSGTDGSVLDPIVAIRNSVVLAPDETVIVDMVYGAAQSRAHCVALVDKYQDAHHKDRAFELAWTHNQVVLQQINASESSAQLYCRLANSILFMNPALRADSSVLCNNNRGQSGLWPYAISGDLPIVLLKIEEHTDISLVHQLIQAHSYWRLKGLHVDVVIWNDTHSGYRQELQNQIAGLISSQAADQAGAIYVRASEQMSNEDRVLFQTVARVIISTSGGSLSDHVNRKALPKVSIPYLALSKTHQPGVSSISLPEDLQFYNGRGGFTKDGTEYVILIRPSAMTPAPWVNVLANSEFGTVISESGQSYTWSENAHEMRLTPWHNDPVSDRGGEAIYLRDEESGHYWSATCLPTNSTSPYLCRHGFGYSIFEHEESGIYSELCVFVDLELHIKYSIMKVRNRSGRARRISVTGYTEWVLGDHRAKTSRMVLTELDAQSGAILARNPYNTEFAGRVAFYGTDGVNRTFTADRTEFIGRNGDLSEPSALSRVRLSGRTGAGLDPCAAFQVSMSLADGQEQEVVFCLGQARDKAEALKLIASGKSQQVVHAALQRVKDYWATTRGQLQVHTPDAALNVMSNGWLLYQTISSRLWARSGFYQSGGAFGFRDQLQDVLSVMQVHPQYARTQLLLCASRQYIEGDVQHWWHPPLERGVRTRCSDDYLWLPFVCAKYVQTTNDVDILNQEISFLDGRRLNQDEESYYDVAIRSTRSESLYQHCVLAIRNAFHYGSHGLALIGSGDWNDGMDKVGIEGKGESIWLSFFLYDTLQKFAVVARLHADEAFALVCEQQASNLQLNIEKHAWDGAWFRRAYFDDGTVLGSAANTECRIDSIAQSWSVLSGAAGPARAEIAMQSAALHLVREDAQLIQLLQPAFDHKEHNPGYIAGYVPGVRENGGQYTHAAVWMIMAMARLGQSEQAWKLLSMINPVNHGSTQSSMMRYKVEPYVLAADVYAADAHLGRGGWTWYTGAASWLTVLITESLLGLQRRGNVLLLSPSMPQAWTEMSLQYRFGNTVYSIKVIRSDREQSLLHLDGVVLPEAHIELVDDALKHIVVVEIP